jgi:phosphoribosyl-ATP pyrophosphohydrolase
MAKAKPTSKTKVTTRAKVTPRPAAASPRPAAVAPAAGTPLDALMRAIEQVRAGERVSVRTTKLLAAGVPKMAQKVIEEAAEVAIDAVRGQRRAIIDESVDLLYNLLVLLNASGVTLGDVWDEMNRRASELGMSEKLPKIGEDI